MDGEISPDALADLIEEDSPVRIVDVRRQADYRGGHIPGSECIPLPSLPDQIESLDGAERVVTVCPHGDASVKAARLIAAYEGIDADTPVESLAGGLAAWDGELVEAPQHTGEPDETPDAPF